MNNIRFGRYQQLGYDLQQKNEPKETEKEQQSTTANQSYENTNFLNLPKDFKLGG